MALSVSESAIYYVRAGKDPASCGQLARLAKLSDMAKMMLHVLQSAHDAEPGLGKAIQLVAIDYDPELLLKCPR